MSSGKRIAALLAMDGSTPSLQSLSMFCLFSVGRSGESGRLPADPGGHEERLYMTRLPMAIRLSVAHDFDI